RPGHVVATNDILGLSRGPSLQQSQVSMWVSVLTLRRLGERAESWVLGIKPRMTFGEASRSLPADHHDHSLTSTSPAVLPGGGRAGNFIVKRPNAPYAPSEPSWTSSSAPMRLPPWHWATRSAPFPS